MYVKGADDSIDLAQARNDRDTPTSAFRPDSPEAQGLLGERPFLQTLKSPGAAQPAQPAGSGIPAPRFGGGPPLRDDGPTNPWADTSLHQEPPSLDPRSLGGAPQPRLSAPNLIVSTLPLMPRADEPFPGAPPATTKPGWQTSLDGALHRVGHLIETTLTRFRTAPQSTQLAIAIAAGGALLLIVSLILLVMLR
jgi:hypothetical protein